MGERAGMVGVEGSLHHQLQIRQQALRWQTIELRLHRRKHTQGRQRRSRFGLAEPLAEQAGGLMQKPLQLGIETSWSGKIAELSQAAEFGGPGEGGRQRKPLN